MLRQIAGFHQDDDLHWVAELECGHNQHVRHQPPFLNRSWVTTPEGRASFLGHSLPCVLCDDVGPSLLGPEGSEPSGT